MTATQNRLTDLLAAQGVDRDRIGDSPDGDTVVVERGDDTRIVVGFDFSDESRGEHAYMGIPHDPHSWIDYTVWNERDEPTRTDGAEPERAAQDIARLAER